MRVPSESIGFERVLSVLFALRDGESAVTRRRHPKRLRLHAIDRGPAAVEVHHESVAVRRLPFGSAETWPTMVMILEFRS